MVQDKAILPMADQCKVYIIYRSVHFQRASMTLNSHLTAIDRYQQEKNW